VVRNESKLEIELIVDAKQGKAEIKSIALESKKAGKTIEDSFKGGKKSLSDFDGKAAEVNKTIKGLAGVIGAAGAAMAVKSFSDKVIQTGIKVDSLQASMEAATGSSYAALDAQAYLRAESERLGLVLFDLTDNYKQLAASSRGTTLEGQATKDIFTSVAQAATALRLSTDETSGAIYAISQMISKGNVQAEELRGQLGERLPGAFQIAARSMGMSTAELGKYLEQGKLVASDFLPKFARALREHYSGQMESSTKSVQADINRMKNSWNDFLKAYSDAGALNFFHVTINKIGNIIDKFTLALNKAGVKINELKAASVGSDDTNISDKMFDLLKEKQMLEQKRIELGNTMWASAFPIGRVNRAAQSFYNQTRLEQINYEIRQLEDKEAKDYLNNIFSDFNKSVDALTKVDVHGQTRTDTIDFVRSHKGEKDTWHFGLLTQEQVEERQQQIKDALDRFNAERLEKEAGYNEQARQFANNYDAWYEQKLEERSKQHEEFYRAEIDLAIEAQKKQEEYFDSMAEHAKTAASSIENSLGDYLFNAINGSWSDLGKSISNILARMVADVTAAQIRMSILGDYSKSGEFGGLIGWMISAGSYYFGGKSAAPAHVSTDGTTAFGMANGGYIAEPVFGRGMKSGASYLFGESGPEFVIPDKKVKSINEFYVKDKPATKNETNVNVVVHNNANAKATVQQIKNNNNEIQLDVFIEQLDAEFAKRASQGRLQLDHAISNIYDLQRRGY